MTTEQSSGENIPPNDKGWQQCIDQALCIGKISFKIYETNMLDARKFLLRVCNDSPHDPLTLVDGNDDSAGNIAHVRGTIIMRTGMMLGVYIYDTYTLEKEVSSTRITFSKPKTITAGMLSSSLWSLSPTSSYEPESCYRYGFGVSSEALVHKRCWQLRPFRIFSGVKAMLSRQLS